MAEEHKHGSMDTSAQEKTFAGFMSVTKWTVIAILAILVFLAIFRT
ncbi:aa3-type cytochrome c oxidase subunit IV [Jannaschia pohangensis]|uniref:Aa3 type cytochrome c oxidase subunit IV n=1 Tax=Jannaschia pohangensis TaxID=390807 RepID=A0A1I3N4B6_9RHOB|nr:aa3-type cytochrome c oxidase subunit IV [Jannaschia pohangensis]SFJ03706.1 aa3 type cytochrome c oxidase subunit IV [Jannaschia pohangensis]